MTHSLWIQFCTLLVEFGDSTSQVPGKEPSVELGKMSFHGDRRHCT